MTDATKSELYWDPFDYGLHDDPHPMWQRMMDEQPLYRNDKFDFWAMTRFDDVLNGFVDWKTFSSARGDQIEIIRGDPPPGSEFMILSMDPPRHTVMRHLLSRAFTPRAISQLEPVTRQYAQELLDQYVGTSGFDFVADFGGKLPGMVIASMLGIPDADRERIRRLSDELVHRDPNETDTDRMTRVSVELGEYFYAQVLERRKNPTDDMMSALLAVEVTDDDGSVRRLNDQEAVAYIHLLAVAGNETTAKLIGWIGSSLASFPAERAKLIARPDLIPSGVEEVLRYEPPALCLGRVVQKDFEAYGQVVAEGSVMILIQAAAGRDRRAFKDPNVFNVERRIERHLSFAFGPHVCLGAALARLEARIATEEVLTRFPEWDVDWAHSEIVHTGSAVRGYAYLPISRVLEGRSAEINSVCSPDKQPERLESRNSLHQNRGSMPIVFNHIGLCVSDTSRSRRFYEDLFEFRYWWEIAPDDDGTGQLLRLTGPIRLRATYLIRDGLVLELLDYGSRDVRRGVERTMDELGLTHMSLSVSDFGGVLPRVPEFGGEVLKDTVSDVSAMVKDPDGQLIELLTDAWQGFLPPRPDQ